MCACRELARMSSKGVDASNQGDHATALEMLQKALEHAEAMGSVIIQAKIRNSLGVACLAAGDNREAARHFSMAKRQVADRVGIENKLYRVIDANHFMARLKRQPHFGTSGASQNSLPCS